MTAASEMPLDDDAPLMRVAFVCLLAHCALMFFSGIAFATFLSPPFPEWLQTPTNQRIMMFGYKWGGQTTVVLGATTGLENYDNDAMHSDSTNRSRITVQTAGRYLTTAITRTDAFLGGVAGAYYRFLFRLNGTTPITGFRMKNTDDTTEAVAISATRTLVLAAGDYIEITFDHTLGGSIDVTLDEFVMTYLTR